MQGALLRRALLGRRILHYPLSKQYTPANSPLASRPVSDR